MGMEWTQCRCQIIVRTRRIIPPLRGLDIGSSTLLRNVASAADENMMIMLSRENLGVSDF